MSEKIRVYIAGPYTKPDPAINVKRAMDVFDELLTLGFIPFCPHLAHFTHINKAHTYEEWLEYVIEWLKQCNVVLRLPGKSGGADREVEIARHRDMHVFDCVFDLVQYRNGRLPWVMYDTSLPEFNCLNYMPGLSESQGHGGYWKRYLEDVYRLPFNEAMRCIKHEWVGAPYHFVVRDEWHRRIQRIIDSYDKSASRTI